MFSALERGEKPGPTTLTENEEVVVFQALDHVREVGTWPLQALSEWKGPPVKHVEVVVHPLFTIFMDMNWNPALWKEAGNNPHRYIELHALAAARDAARVLKEDPDAIPLHYFYVRELIKETGALMARPPENTLRVLDVSRRSMIRDDGRREAYDAFLKTIARDRAACIDSMEPGTGKMQARDSEKICDLLTNGASIGIQGGYLLDNCTGAACLSVLEQLKARGRNDVTTFINTGPSSDSSNIFRNSPNYTATTEDPAGKVYGTAEKTAMREDILREPSLSPEDKRTFRDFFSVRIAPPTTLNSWEDLKAWVANNGETNEKYDAYLRLHQRMVLANSSKTRDVAVR
jgi:hypothetical protein